MLFASTGFSFVSREVYVGYLELKVLEVTRAKKECTSMFKMTLIIAEFVQFILK